MNREQLEEIFDEDIPLKNKEEDGDSLAIALLRNKIPYDKCKSIIVAAEHDIIYLVDLDTVLEYINEDDAKKLRDYGLHIESENDCLASFV